MRMCQCCGTETFFVEFGSVCRRYPILKNENIEYIVFQKISLGCNNLSINCRYCYKQYWPNGKRRNRVNREVKKFGVAVNCTLNPDHNITKQDAEDNLFPLRPSLVPAEAITCQIKRYY